MSPRNRARPWARASSWPGYRNTQNVRRFLREQCGEGFRFDRTFMAWIRSGAPATMGEVVDEWLRRHGP
ncbi:DUF6434 domain-containing protein [Pseudomonas citronellolis]|uniref:DUF6434 domain-containing protein n=1 Tax=Pseudomonas citronellolis TaxID=53408 RepID=UPI000718945B|nr:DUF6434 domain-containing protein [Pseudomonas citronellolis]KRV72537.1 hypothetical protein AO742_18850 [Pseudomonas citronellolis]KRW77511.1 hypothetical protein AO738_19250 [Pseudomonas citronellolis]